MQTSLRECHPTFHMAEAPRFELGLGDMPLLTG